MANLPPEAANGGSRHSNLLSALYVLFFAGFLTLILTGLAMKTELRPAWMHMRVLFHRGAGIGEAFLTGAILVLHLRQKYRSLMGIVPGLVFVTCTAEILAKAGYPLNVVVYLAVLVLSCILIGRRDPEGKLRGSGGIKLALSLSTLVLVYLCFFYGHGLEHTEGKLTNFRYRNLYLDHETLGYAGFLMLLAHSFAGARKAGMRHAAFSVLGTFAVLMGLIEFFCYKSTVGLRGKFFKEAASPAGLVLDVGAAPGQGRRMTADQLIPSKSCDGRECHEVSYWQWEVSAHRFASANKPYQKVLKEYLSNLEGRDPFFCSRCHSPMNVLLGVVEDPDDPSQERLRREGISCQTCHQASRTAEEMGNGNFSIAFRGRVFPLFREESEAEGGFAGRYVVNQRRDHRRKYTIPFDNNDLCNSCHRVILRPPITKSRRYFLGDAYGHWLDSPAKAKGISCLDCHMPLRKYEGHMLHDRPDHQYIALTTSWDLMVPRDMIPENVFSRFQENVMFLWRGNLKISKYEQLYLKYLSNAPSKQIALETFLDRQPIQLEITSLEAIEGGKNLAVDLRLVNLTGAHPFPAGPLDLNEAWIAIEVTGPGGAPICATGGLDEKGRVEEGAIHLGARVLGEDGLPVQRHRFWEASSLEGRKIVPIDGDLRERAVFLLPQRPPENLHVRAKLLYRRYNQEMADWIFGGGVTFPVLELASDEKPVDLAAEN